LATITESKEILWTPGETKQIITALAIRNVGVFPSSFIIWKNGKRLVIKFESSLNQPVTVQVVGDIVESLVQVSNIGLPIVVPANGRISIGLAWGDWMPFIAITAQTLIAPTTGLINAWAIEQR